jgi:UDP-glucuronate 4-epimerase
LKALSVPGRKLGIPPSGEAKVVNAPNEHLGPRMSVLVTGAAGFIGSHLVDRLLERGESVVGLDCFDTFYDPGVKEANLAGARGHARFRELRGDIRDHDTLHALPTDIDTVVHLAARAGVRPSIRFPLLYESVNVQGTLSILEWMRERAISRLVFASSSSVYGNSCPVPFSEEARVLEPISPYAATKLSGELMCHVHHHLHGLSILALRLFTVYGPRQRPDLAIHRFARLMRAGEPIEMFGDGSSQRDYTYIDDILDGIGAAIERVRAGDHRYEVINLGGNRMIPLAEMVRVLGEELGVEPCVVTRPTQPGDVERTYANIDKASRLLGYQPLTPFREGIREFVRWLDQSAADGPRGARAGG